MRSKKKFINQTSLRYLELLVVILIILILLGIIVSAYSGVQSRNRNSIRHTSIDSLQKDLEQYYADNNYYPSLSNLNNAKWIQSNMKYLNPSILTDPSSNTATFTISSAKNHYSYSVKSLTGDSCDNKQVKCSEYILTATLEGGGIYTASSLN